jgi:hypothetical protein
VMPPVGRREALSGACDRGLVSSPQEIALMVGMSLRSRSGTSSPASALKATCDGLNRG